MVPPAQAEPRGGQLLSHTLLPVAGRLQTSCIALLSPAAAAAELLLGSHTQGGAPPSQKPPGSIRLEAGTLSGAVPWDAGLAPAQKPGPWCLSPWRKLSVNLPGLQRDWWQKKIWKPGQGLASCT